MSPHAAIHGNQCCCATCKAALKQQYHADMDRASHWAVRTTPEHEVIHGIALSLDWLQPKLDEIVALKARVAQLERQLAVLDFFDVALIKADEAGEPRGLELDGKVWTVKPGDVASHHWRRWMEAEDNERKAMR